MASVQNKLFILFLRLIRKKTLLRRQLSTKRFNQYACDEPPKNILQHCHVHHYQINGHSVFTMSPREGARTNRHVLYFHGGAYVQGFTNFHWKFLAWLVQSTGCTVTTPDHPLAPDYSFEDSFAMADVVYKQLLKKVRADDLLLMGDSSGGGFALAFAQKMVKEKMVQPHRIILLSPWLDITLNNPEIRKLEAGDPFLEKISLQQAGRLYAKNTNHNYYLLSPVNGSLKGLGKLAVFVGSKEILLADARKLKALAEANGEDIDYFEYKDMFHAWMLLNLPESKKARQQIIDLVQN